ncbi:MAG: purine/pyrimidine permease [Deltaproteobacteria bacterium]|nr:purine/pyrimidine permease [Deltaproteobacteria bacterium]
MAKKPAGLIYWVDDKPPWPVLGLLAVQHVFLMSSTLVLPIVLVSEIGGDFNEVRAVVALTMMACGLGTIVQAMRWAGIGSGYLCPNLCGPNFFAVSMGAAWLGGLPLMRGMTIAAGLVEAVFARVLHRLEFLFPSEVTGLVVLMVALGLVPLSASKFLHVDYAGEPIQGVSLLVAALTLLVMVGVNIWGTNRLKLYGVLIGMAVGYALSFGTGLLTAIQFRDVATVPWVGLPRFEGMWQFSFRWSLLPAFTIVSICGALKSFGNLIMCEKVNDEEWTRPDIRRIGDGLMADSICVAVSGLLGGVASDTSASNVALSNASGATSRWIGFAAGGLFILLGFFPKLSAMLSIMPTPVAGAILIFVVCFMIMSGLQIILSSKPDTRKTFVVGIALSFGISLDVLPELYAHIGPWLRPLFESSLTLTTVVAVLLNQLFRLGAKETVSAAEVPSEG